MSDTGEDPTTRTPEQVRAEIEQTQQELAETVEALAAKSDVKAQARRAVDDAKTTVREKVADVKESASGAADSLAGQAQEATPASVSDAGARASELVRENRPAVIALGALILGFLLGRRRSS
jgi:ElaB/YqjD/DUF883 family membrane-anchored ribosome-binding protein